MSQINYTTGDQWILNDQGNLLFRNAGNGAVICVSQEQANSFPEDKKPKINWSYNDTLFLINLIDSRFESMNDVRQRKDFWKIIAEEMISNGFNYDENCCKKKWQNLVRSYKNVKDTQLQTGKGATKFAFFNRLDEILGSQPNNSSAHTIDVASVNENPKEAARRITSTEDDSIEADLVEEMKTEEKDTEPTEPISSKKERKEKKRKNVNVEYVNIKKVHYEQQQKIAESKRAKYEQYVTKKITLLERKVELEERKVRALEALAKTAE